VPFRIGQALPMRAGSDALIVATGVMLKPALDAAAALEKVGVETAVLHLPTIKPFDTAAVCEWAGRVAAVVSVEEHTVIGGLGSAVAEAIAEADFETPKRFRRIGLPDVFPDKYGSQASLMARYGLTADRIAETVQALLRSANAKVAIR
jgi:transketolase